MIEALIYRLNNYLRLSDEDKQALRDSVTQVVEFERNQKIISDNERPDHVHVVIEGWACRYKYVEEGKRAILGFLVPGDMVDVHVALLDHMDHSVMTLSPAKFALIPRETITHIFENHTSLAYGLFWAALVEESIQREWFVNNTSRPADKRLAHLCCEMLMRHRAAGLTQESNIEFPLTQQDLADAMGVTNVHVNRVLQRLREDEMLAFHHKRMTFTDWDRLKAFAEFDPGYMHLTEQDIENPT
ncbi:Crp/Fnr family transcriptional regulator [Halomonas sp. WWR20]